MKKYLDWFAGTVLVALLIVVFGWVYNKAHRDRLDMDKEADEFHLSRERREYIINCTNQIDYTTGDHRNRSLGDCSSMYESIDRYVKATQ